MKLRTVIGSLLVLAVLSACTSLGLAPAKSFDEKLAYAYGVHTALESSAATAVRAHELTQAEGANVLKIADNAREVLDSAKAIEATDAAGAATKLALATSILNQLQAYLAKRGSS